MSKPAPLDRFSAFSDGVFAIAITILVLELPVPDVDAPLAATLLEDWSAFVGYFISFSMIGGIWIQHSSLTRLMRRADIPSYALNLVILLFVGMLPFSTKVLVTHLGQSEVGIAVLVYGINALLASVTLSVLMMYVATQQELLTDRLADDQVRAIYMSRWISIGLNFAALFLAFVMPLVALLVYLVQSLILIVLPLFQLRILRKAQPKEGL